MTAIGKKPPYEGEEDHSGYEGLSPKEKLDKAIKKARPVAADQKALHSPNTR
jgi:hypothetical protein